MNNPFTPSSYLSLLRLPQISPSTPTSKAPSRAEPFATYSPRHWICGYTKGALIANMKACSYQQNAFLGCVAGETRRVGGGAADSMADGVVCPKPRRLSVLNCSSVHVPDPIRPSRFLQINNQQLEGCESKAGRELMDIVLAKGIYGEKANFQAASSPPFFCGSPPSRSANPLIQDAQFGNEKFNPFSPSCEATPPSPSSSSARKSGGCARMKFGPKPAPVRIEGFDCRGSCSISAVA